MPRLLAVALGMAGLWSAKAQAPDPAPVGEVMTLDAAIRLAQSDNPEIRVLSADVASAQGEAITAQTRPNPEASVAPGFDTTSNPAETKFYGEFGLEQTFEWPGKRALRQALAEKDIALRRLALAGFRSQLAIQVRRAYFTLLAAGKIVSLREQRLALAESFVAAARKKAGDGYAPEFEVTKAEVEVVSAQKTLREAQARQAAARVALNALTGRRPGDPLAVAGALDSTLQLPGQTTLLEQALAQNPAVQIQAAEVERTGLNLQATRKSRLPDFKAGPKLQTSRDEQIVLFALTLPLPIWDQKKGEVATAAAGQEKARAELDKLRREILRDVATAAQNLTAAAESLAFYTPALRDKLKSALDAAAQGYAEGRTPLLLYLESQRTYFDTQADYFDTLQKLYETRAELESALGVPLDRLANPINETK